MALEDNIKKFEDQNGEIKIAGGADKGKPFGFQSPQVQMSEKK